MTTTTISGSDFLLDLFAAITEPDSGWPLPGHLDIAAYLSDDWDSQSYDPDASKAAISFKSAQGSTLRFNKAGFKNDISGESKGALIITTTRGDSAVVNFSDRWSSGNEFNSAKVNWNYIGELSDKNDDFSYRSQYASSVSESKGKTSKSNTAMVIFSNTDYKFNVSIVRSEESQSADSGAVVDISTTTFSKYKLTDITNEFELKFSGTLNNDNIAGTASFNIKDLKMDTSAYTMTIANFRETIDRSLLKDIPILPRNNLSELYGAFSSLETVVMQGDNLIKITSADGITLDAGKGNDTVVGGKGADVLQGGLGRDSMSGNAGADIFIFAVGDSSISSSQSDVVADFKVADDDQIRLEGLTDIRCTVAKTAQKNFSLALTAAAQDFADGANVSLQFVGKGALLFTDFNEDITADLVVALTGLKAGNAALVNYAESGEMFA